MNIKFVPVNKNNNDNENRIIIFIISHGTKKFNLETSFNLITNEFRQYESIPISIITHTPNKTAIKIYEIIETI
jgi:hypothetical protein